MYQQGWRTFDADFRAEITQHLSFFEGLAQQMAMQRPPFHAGDMLASLGYTLAEIGPLAGPDAIKPHCLAALPLIAAGCAELNINAPGRVPTVVGLLALRVTLVNVLGDAAVWPPPADAWGMDLANRPIRPDADYLLAAAWSTWALGDHQASLAILPQRPTDAAPLAPPRDPTTRLHYARAGYPASAEGHLASWALLLDDLPMMLETRAMNWGLLQSMGAATYKALGPDRPEVSAAAWIHATVAERLVS